MIAPTPACELPIKRPFPLACTVGHVLLPSFKTNVEDSLWSKFNPPPSARRPQVDPRMGWMGHAGWFRLEKPRQFIGFFNKSSY